MPRTDLSAAYALGRQLTADALHRAAANAMQLPGLQHADAARQRGPDGRLDGGAVFRRPSIVPSLLALAKPARTRSWIIARSNSATTPIIWNIACQLAWWCRGPADARTDRS